MDWLLFEQRLSRLMEKEHIPGAALAVSQNGNIIYQKGFGVQNLETRLPVTPETIFGTASVTKSFTAIAILKLEEEGKLSVQDPVIQYLPDFHIPAVPQVESIKIHHLLTHSTGLAPVKRREELGQFHEHLAYLKEYNQRLLGEPGEFISYCNDTFLLLGAIIERVTGRLFRRYVTEEILSPLRMDRSTFSREELHKFANVSTPYVFNKETGKNEPQDWPALGNYEAGGGIRSSVLDLLKYGSLHLNQIEEAIISQKQLEKMRKLYMPLHGTSYYGYALEITPNYHGITLVEHSGGQPGVSSNFGFVPEQQLAAAVLTNVSDVSAKEIWLEAINTALGLPVDEKRYAEPYAALSEEQKKRFTGTYRSEEGTCLGVIFKDGDLILKMDNELFALRTSGDTKLVIKETDKPIRFYFDQGGSPWAAFLGFRMLLRES